MSDDVIDVEAEAIDSPAVSTETERWLAGVRDRVAAKAADLMPRPVTSAEEYRQCKRERTACRALIKEVEDEKRSMTKALRDALSRVNDATSQAVLALTQADEGYRRELGAWEASVVSERRGELEARWNDEWPDLAALVPFGMVWDKFSKDKKWSNYGTKTEAAWQDVAKQGGIAEGIAAELHTIETVCQCPDELAATRADYLSTLDCQGVIKRAMARREAAEAARRAEEERRAWEEQQPQIELTMHAADARQAEQEAQERQQAPEPEQAPTEAPAAPQTGSPRLIVMQVEVPAERWQEFKAAMVALGCHGKLVRKEF